MCSGCVRAVFGLCSGFGQAVPGLCSGVFGQVHQCVRGARVRERGRFCVFVCSGCVRVFGCESSAEQLCSRTRVRVFVPETVFGRRAPRGMRVREKLCSGGRTKMSMWATSLK